MEGASAWLWLRVYGAGFLLVLALLAWSFYTQAPYGDLTRIGALSESRFGWREEQPAIEADLLTSVPIEQAEILVVGDSFSVAPGPQPQQGLLWQSRLVAAGYRVASLHWDRAHPLCSDFQAWLTQAGFHGRWVLFESVERALDDRLTTSQPCGSAARAAAHAFTVPPPWPRPPAPGLNTNEKLLTGISTAWNSWRAGKTVEPAVFKDLTASESIRMQPYPPGCQHFSHVACDRALFLLDDERNPPLHARHLPMMALKARSTQPWRVAWVIVPNKRTYYLNAAAFAPVSALIEAQGLGPDVLAGLLARSAGLRDVYLPNDTHLSPRGAVLLGETVMQWLSQQSP